jgi:cysteinyl-tRNA synthetase
VVIDYSRDGSAMGKFSKHEINLMKKKPDGSPRIVLAYLSIGEAEDYRFYWKNKLKKNPPSWLQEENSDWPGNYKVHYWNPSWQQIIFGKPTAYLDQLIDMEFDGVYLDIIDGFEYYQDSIPDAAKYMADFVSKLSKYAKSKSKNPFYVIGQNGETLIDNHEYLQAIDGIAKEDLYYGLEEEGVKNDSLEIAFSLEYLRKAKSSGKKILVIDYVLDQNKQDSIRKNTIQEGFIPFFSVRDLDRIIYDHGSRQDKEPTGRLTPGRFYSVIMPKGTLRSQIISDYYTEKFYYYIPKNSQEDYEFIGRDYFEWTNSLLFYYSFRHHWELGLQLPVTYAHVLPDPTDVFNIHKGPNNYNGIGMAQLIINHGKSWNHYNDNMLLEVNIGLPTDQRKNPFNPGTYGTIRFTREHYGKRVGLMVIGALNYYTNSDFSGFGGSPEIQIGLGLKGSEKFFCSTFLVQDFLMTRAEFNAEYLLGKRSSIETSIGKGFINSQQTLYASLILNYIFR